MKLSQFKDSQLRREYLEKKLNIQLNLIGENDYLNEEIHCENLIGQTTLPIGIAGPIKIKFLKREKEYFLPLATTEGALLASVNRGCKAINLSGCLKVIVKKNGTTRGPVYFTKNIDKGFWFLSWLDCHLKEIKREAETTSNYLKFLRLQGKVIGPYTFVRFYFDCDQAMGMNMVTIAVDKINQYIKKETGIECLSLSGNFCIDKKPSWLNFIEGRGYQTWAEVKIKKEILKKVLKTNAKDLYNIWLSKNLVGSAITGSLGFNGHFANVVAAFFAATGQDLGHTVEGSQGITVVQTVEEDLYFSVHLPSLLLGLVGGGTKLKIKRQALAIIGAKNSEELAAVLTGGVLAGELSLLASLAEGSLAKIHKKLGR